MSKHIVFSGGASLTAFLVTLGIAIPAGWRALEADIATNGKRVRSLQGTFTVDGVEVTVDVDRGVVMTGDSVTAKLVAFSKTRKDVVVDLTVLQSHNYEGSRVESPQIPIDHEKLTLHAAPEGGAPVRTSFTLGTMPNDKARTDNFRIYVAPHGVKPPKHEYDNGRDYSFGLDSGAAAAVGVVGWSGNNLGISIKAVDKIVDGAPFTIAVRVKNTSGQKLARMPWVSLATQVGVNGYLDIGDDFEITQIESPAETDDDTGHDRQFKRGAVMTVKFAVVPKKKGLKEITFAASAFESDEEIGPTTAGAIDARTFKVSEANPTVAVK